MMALKTHWVKKKVKLARLNFMVHTYLINLLKFVYMDKRVSLLSKAYFVPTFTISDIVI